MSAPAQRTQPHNLDAERAVIGSVFIRPTALDDVVELAIDDFFLPAHREIFEAMRAVAARGHALDVLAVTDELKSRGMLQRIEGGETYLLACANGVPTSDNVRHYARIVAERSALRRLIATATEIQSAAYGDCGDVSEFLSEARRKISAIEIYDRDDEPRLIGDGLAAMVESLPDRAAHPENYFVQLGIRSFDEKIGGMRGGQLVIVAARPGKGKSALALGACVYNAILGVPTLLFSMEMTHIEVQERVLSAEARVNGRKIITGKLGAAEWSRVTRAEPKVATYPLKLYTKNVTVERICAMSRRWFNRLPDPPDGRKKKALIAVDYVGLVLPGPSAAESEAQEIGRTTGALKQLAVDLDLPVMALSQLNREIEKATKQRKPVMSDLRGSGSLEQDANMVIFPWWMGESPHYGRKEAELIVGKNRGGVMGEVDVDWWPEYTRFADREDSAFTLFDGTGETGRAPYAEG
jgi:replicative DNA helicase